MFPSNNFIAYNFKTNILQNIVRNCNIEMYLRVSLWYLWKSFYIRFGNKTATSNRPTWLILFGLLASHKALSRSKRIYSCLYVCYIYFIYIYAMFLKFSVILSLSNESLVLLKLNFKVGKFKLRSWESHFKNLSNRTLMNG